MRSHSIASSISRHGAGSLVELPPPFLAPALYSPIIQLPQRSHFSSTSPSLARDRSKYRGVSAIHRSGLRHPLSVSKLPLPVPENVVKHETRQTNPNHGLWAFFHPTKAALPTPEQEYAHGRAWTIQEIRQKSWDDLHSLWWVCAKERNRIATSGTERERLKAGYGDFEAQSRDKTVRATQAAIQHVLRERWYAWSEARELYNTGARPERDDHLEVETEDKMPEEVSIEDIKLEDAKPTRAS
ncbi:54S ribosomal protein L4 mitochondrial [Myotisia sp. PD_48]|nr:54S ribosomal protein L4 mitochondrial [Myotisia sp. PD_48]